MHIWYHLLLCTTTHGPRPSQLLAIAPVAWTWALQRVREAPLQSRPPAASTLYRCSTVQPPPPPVCPVKHTRSLTGPPVKLRVLSFCARFDSPPAPPHPPPASAAGARRRAKVVHDIFAEFQQSPKTTAQDLGRWCSTQTDGTVETEGTTAASEQEFQVPVAPPPRGRSAVCATAWTPLGPF